METRCEGKPSEAQWGVEWRKMVLEQKMFVQLLYFTDYKSQLFFYSTVNHAAYTAVQ